MLMVFRDLIHILFLNTGNKGRTEIQNGHVCPKNKIFLQKYLQLLFQCSTAFWELLSGVQRLLFILFLFLAELSAGVCQTSSITVNWMLSWPVQDKMNNLLNIIGIERPSSAEMTSVKSRQDRLRSVACPFTSNRDNESVSEE